MQFGQILDHDLTLTPEMNLCSPGCPAEPEINCCDFIGQGELPKSCWPIDTTYDQFYGAEGINCLDFKRSQPLPCNYSDLMPEDR